MLLSRAAPLAALIAALGCGDDGGASADAGRDGGPRDGGPRDGGRRDGGRRDGGRDAGPRDGGPAGWVPLPGLPDGCVIERAEHPEVLFTPEWVGCGEGCERLAPPPPGWNRVIHPDVGSFDRGRGCFVLITSESLETPRLVLLTSIDRPLAAWRSPPGTSPGICRVGPMAMANGAVALAIRVMGDTWPRQERIYHAPLDEIGRQETPVAILDESWLPGTNATQHLATSATTVAAEVQLAGYVAIAEGGGLFRAGGWPSATPGTPQNVQVSGRTVYWEDWYYREGWGDAARVAFASFGTPSALLLAPPDHDVKSFRVDDAHMAWMAGFDRQPDGTYARLELWASPLATSPAELAPRFVRAMRGRVEAQMGDGIYAITTNRDGRGAVELFDLEDGRRRTFFIPDGVYLGSPPLYVTRDEMLLAGRYERQGTALRVQLAALPYDG